MRLDLLYSYSWPLSKLESDWSDCKLVPNDIVDETVSIIWTYFYWLKELESILIILAVYCLNLKFLNF